MWNHLASFSLIRNKEISRAKSRPLPIAHKNSDRQREGKEPIQRFYKKTMTRAIKISQIWDFWCRDRRYSVDLEGQGRRERWRWARGQRTRPRGGWAGRAGEAGSIGSAGPAWSSLPSQPVGANAHCPTQTHCTEVRIGLAISRFSSPF